MGFFFDADGIMWSFPGTMGMSFMAGGTIWSSEAEMVLWSALSGRAFDGPQKDRQLQPDRVGHWLCYIQNRRLQVDGKKYPSAPLPTQLSPEAQEETADNQLQAMTCSESWQVAKRRHFR
jgi:hypothetical protein